MSLAPSNAPEAWLVGLPPPRSTNSDLGTHLRATLSVGGVVFAALSAFRSLSLRAILHKNETCSSYSSGDKI